MSKKKTGPNKKKLSANNLPKPVLPGSDDKKLLNKDIFKIYNGLASCQKFKGRDFAYFLARNGRILQEEIKDLEKSVEVTDALKEFREKIADLRNKFKVVVDGPVTPEFTEEEDKLIKKYKKTLDAYQEEYDGMLDGESKIKVFKIDFKYVPNDIDGAAMSDIFDCIDK